MNIAIIGYGKMGKEIESIAKDRGHIITKIIKNKSDQINFNNVDVAIDFSTPESAFENIKQALENKIPTVSGTTGWIDKLNQTKEICSQYKTAFLYSSNFSIGMNLFFDLNKKLSQLMENQSQYQANMTEIHHIHKVDAPSGTALSLKESIKSCEIKSIRTGDVPGTHIINYKSKIDSIEIKHEAHNRKGFALGAVVAAEWLQNKKGVFEMKDVLNLK
jgi:4-hydroxy-tetrahydrodipicolinate reductase